MKKNQHHQNRSSSSCNKATNTADIPNTATASRTEHDHSEQQQPSFSLFSFSLKRRYLFCCMAISLLAIDLIRKNAILRVIQIMSTDGDNNNNQEQQAVARTGAVVPFFQTHSVAVKAMEKNGTNTTTPTTTSRRHSPFPWRNVLEFTLMMNNNESNNHNPHPPLPLCQREDILRGRWIPTLLPDGAPYITNTVHLRCHPKEYYQQVPFPTYTWSVLNSSNNSTNIDNNDINSRTGKSSTTTNSSCDFTTWTWQLSCRLLSHATVLIVGDSLSWEQYSSLVQLHPNGSNIIKQGYQHQSRYLKQNIVLTVCASSSTSRKKQNGNQQPSGGGAGGVGVRLVFRRDDHLEFLQQAIKDDFPTVLILNRGAHYVNDTRFIQQLQHDVLPIVQEWLHTCRFVYKIKCHFFWRTSVPGHVGCATAAVNATATTTSTTRGTGSSNTSTLTTGAYKPLYTHPNNNRHEVEAIVANLSNYNDHTMMYHWYDYQRQNQLALQELESWAITATADKAAAGEAQNNDNNNDSAHAVPFYYYRIIDAYYINILRPDEHRAHDGDCLHNCYPGKMDVYNQLLLHYLRMDRTLADVIKLKDVAHLLPKSGTSSTRSSSGSGHDGNGTNYHHYHSVESTTPYNRQAWETAMAKARNKRRSKTSNYYNNNQTVVPAAAARQDDHGNKKRKDNNDDKTKRGKKQQQARDDTTATTTVLQ